jgi:nicotinate phosphoribosyltransferase
MNRGDSLGLFTDFYELTMAQAYWQSGTTGPATFSMFFRKYPPERAYFVAAGLSDVLDYLKSFRFTSSDIEYLRSLREFDDDFLQYLGDVCFTGSVHAMSEGTIFFANEPVIEVTAPIIEAQLAETFIVNQIHLQTILATKASRVRHAARDKRVVDFAARRTHGIDAANKLARVSYLVGFDGTSNTMAGLLYGIPVFGTMAHSFVTSFPSEIESFRKYAQSFPDNSTLLVDTYDTLEGARKASIVAAEMQQQRHRLRAIRLDSGDLGDLAKRVRALFDAAGQSSVRIFASGGLDEFEVEELLNGGAPIDGFGVGTKVGVSADAPYGDCAYKLVEYDGTPVLKLSPGKQTLPGPKQVHRFRHENGEYFQDVVACRNEALAGKPDALLDEVMRKGTRVCPSPTLEEARQHFLKEWQLLPAQHKHLRSPAMYRVEISDDLQALQARVVREIEERELKK